MSDLADPAVASGLPRIHSNDNRPLEGVAAMEFEPWQPTEWEPPPSPGDENHDGYFCYLRVAYKIMFRSKSDLVKMVRVMNQEGDVSRLLQGFSNAEYYFGVLHQIAESAHARLLCAAAAANP